MREKRKQRGSAMLEAALIITVFMVTLIAIFDISMYLFLTQSVKERCRQALREGVVQVFDATAIENVVLYGQATEPAGAGPSFNLERSMINVERLSAGTSEDRIALTISGYSYRLLTPTLTGRPLHVYFKTSAPYEGI